MSLRGRGGEESGQPASAYQGSRMESDVKVQRGPRTAAAIQSVGAGLPTQAQDQCDRDWPGTCDWEGTEMSVAEVLPACLAYRSRRISLAQVPLHGRCQPRRRWRQFQEMMGGPTSSAYALSAIVRHVAAVMPWSAPGLLRTVHDIRGRSWTGGIVKSRYPLPPPSECD